MKTKERKVSKRMKGIKAVKFGVVGAAAAAAVTAGVFLAMSAFAVAGEVSITDGSADPAGGTGTVELRSNVGDPGLGAWTVDIQYDTSVVLATECEEDSGSVCNVEYAEDMVRITGASASGETGDTLLGTVTFECQAEGESPLTLIAGDEDHPFADATIGDPQPVDPLTITDGVFTCAVEPTDEPEEPTDVVDDATDVPSDLPDTGTGSTGGSDDFGWVMVALAAVGLAGVAGYGALRLRSR
jgi:hypothetical protein